jgi:hypothetical protein
MISSKGKQETFDTTYTPLHPTSPPPPHVYYTAAAPQRPRVAIPMLLTKQVACLQDGCQVVKCCRHCASIFHPIEMSALFPINQNIPPMTNLTPPHINVNVRMDTSLLAGATFNVDVREELRKAREEVECLKRQNKHVLEDNKRLNEVNRDAPESTEGMYEFGVGKHVAELTMLRSQIKENASHLDTELKKSDIEKHNIYDKGSMLLRGT